jgi:two-component system response regulator AtoC
VKQLLQQRDWRGNIRELENCVARYVLLGSIDTLHTEFAERHPLPGTYEVAQNGSIPLKHIGKQTAREVERNVILRVLQANNWNRRKAAEILHISYRALLYKINQAGLPPKRPRKGSETGAEGTASPAPPSD